MGDDEKKAHQETRWAFGMDQLLNLFPIFTAIVTAAWTAWVFLQFQAREKDLSNRQLELTLKLSQNKLNLSEERRVGINSDLKITCDGERGLYTATMSFSIANLSDNDVEVSWVLEEFF